MIERLIYRLWGARAAVISKIPGQLAWVTVQYLRYGRLGEASGAPAAPDVHPHAEWFGVPDFGINRPVAPDTWQRHMRTPVAPGIMPIGGGGDNWPIPDPSVTTGPGYAQQIKAILANLDKRVLDPTAENYGAAGDGVAVDTTPLKNVYSDAGNKTNGAARGSVVYLPPTTEFFTDDPIPIEWSNISTMGAGSHSSRITNTTTDVFHLGTATTAVHQLNFEKLRIDATGGHIFDVLDQISACTFRDVFLIQNGDGFSAWRQANDRDMIWCLFDHCRWQHTNSATVPTIDLRGDLVSVNEWRHNEPINTGNYWLWAEPSTAGAYHWNNQVRGLFCEQTTGGMVKMMASRAALIEDVSVFDLQNVSSLQRDGIVVGESAAGTRSFKGKIERYVRAGGTLAAGVFDINTEGSQGETIEHVDATGDTPEIQLGTSWHQKKLHGVGGNISGGRASLTRLVGHLNENIRLGETSLAIGAGDGAPTHSVPDGSIYLRRDGGSGTTFYVRENGSWVAK